MVDSKWVMTDLNSSRLQLGSAAGLAGPPQVTTWGVSFCSKAA